MRRWAGSATAEVLHTAGVVNCRDLGGIVLGLRGRLAPGRLLRSASFAHAKQETLIEALRRIPPGIVVDLRTEREVIRDGGLSHLAEIGWRWNRMPVGEAAPSHHDPLGCPNARVLAAARNVTRLSRPEGPVILTCSLGKDRTGRVIAQLLVWLGAGRDAILADFLESNTQLAREVAVLPARFKPGSRGYSEVTPTTIEATLRCLPWKALRPLPAFLDVEPGDHT
jgi:protein-tyrosine phosphatase